jgi:hypothetical protein
MEAPVLAVPTPRTFTVGEIETAAFYNSSVRDAVGFLIGAPICNAVQATAQTVNSGIWTPLTLDSTVVDSYGGHSNSTNNSRYTAQVAGWYQVSGAVCWAANTTGWRGVRTLRNGVTATVGGATEVQANTVAAALTTLATPTVIVFLNVGDYVEVEGYQTTGAQLLTAVNSDANCAITVVWLHT